MQVLLLREKVSKLSESLSLNKSIFMVVKKTSQESEEEMTKLLAMKTVSLKSQMDHASLAEQAVGLNLKLMKWR
jgi:CO dehydrogenase nickel-insertion accessory protein CooC1